MELNRYGFYCPEGNLLKSVVCSSFSAAYEKLKFYYPNTYDLIMIKVIEKGVEI